MTPSQIRLGMLVLSISLSVVSPAWTQQKRATLGFEPTPEVQKAPEEPPADPTKVVTGVPVVPKADGAEPRPVLRPIDWMVGQPDYFSGRYTLRTDVGDGVGYSRGFTYLEAMIPLKQSSQTLWFTDLRLVNFDQENRWEYNLGTGYRCPSPFGECILGVNGFYDARKTDYHYYQQIGLGFEALSRGLEFRMNGYWIVGAGHRLIGDTGVVNQGIANNNFIFQQTQTIEFARGGGEVELGGRIPGLDRFAVRAYGGFYTYSAEGAPTANGARGRLEAQLSERVSLHFAVQNDAVYNTTVTGGLAISFGAPAYRRGTGRASWEDVLHQRVYRDINIVIDRTTTTTTTAVPVPPPPPPPPPPEILD